MIRKKGPWGLLFHGQTAQRGAWVPLKASQHEKNMGSSSDQAFGVFLSTCAERNNRKNLQWGPGRRGGGQIKMGEVLPAWLPFPIHSQRRTDTLTKAKAVQEACVRHLLYA